MKCMLGCGLDLPIRRRAAIPSLPMYVVASPVPKAEVLCAFSFPMTILALLLVASDVEESSQSPMDLKSIAEAFVRAVADQSLEVRALVVP